MSSRTASRYQRGLSYEPGMQGSRYAPTRASADLGNVGDYSGVSPIPGAGGDGGGVVAPQSAGTGNGLGSGGNMLAGLALTALTNPRVTDYATRLIRGDNGTGAAFNLGRPLDSTATYEQLFGTPVRDGSGVTIDPMPTTTNNGVTFRDLGSQQGGNALTGGARVLDNSLSYEQLMGLPYRPDAGVTISPMSPTTGPGGVQFREVPWPDGGVSGTDGGTSGIDFGGVGDGGAGAGGGWLSGLQGMAYEPGLTGLDGIVGSGLMGGGFDIYSGAATLGAGALGNYVAANAGYENGRDPLGRNIGAGLGSAVGGIFLGPVGAFLGAQLGGAIGGQFGPQGTVGANWGALNAWAPDGQGGGSWGYQSGADNGGQVNNPAAQAFQQALMNYAQGQGYQIDPMAQGAQYQFGQYSGNGPNAPGQGWFYQPGSGPQGFQYFYGNDLTAPVMSAGPQGFFGPMTATDQTKGDLMLSNAFNDLLAQGLFIPQGTGLSGDALQTALADRAQQQATGAANAYQASVMQTAPGN